MTLDQLRAVKQVHGMLTEHIPGPPGIADAIRSFRFFKLYGIACIVEDKFPALTRCWKDLDRLFMHDRAFGDDVFVPSWILMDFPCDAEGRTALDHFESFVATTEEPDRFREFIQAARGTRLGLYESVLRSTSAARFRELFTGRVVDVYPSIEPGSPGEIVLGRTFEADGQVYFWGDVKAFPAEARLSIEDMVTGKLAYFFAPDATAAELYETFMKLAGPYWMSVVAANDALPILAPNHYLTYSEAE